MHVIEATNIRDALPQATRYLLEYGVLEKTRVGPAYVAPCPVTIHYKIPKQHVLLNPIRDANPFFHLMEAIWMLAGRDDSAFLDNYIKDFGKKFGKNGTIMDAYGQRWRRGLRYDQLDQMVIQLRKEPHTRQCVLQMWNAGRDDLMAYSMKPCNLVATFRIKKGRLDMTVFNRSNDLIWGCCGANAVHFPILQEYLAARIGVELGEYWQVSTNLHMYMDHVLMMDKRVPRLEQSLENYLVDTNKYELTYPLVYNAIEFDEDLEDTMGWIEDIHQGKEIHTGDIVNPFFYDVVIPMAFAHKMYKLEQWDDAFESINEVKAEDWRRAGSEWLLRRQNQ